MTNNEVLIEIKDLSCSYNRDIKDRVLFINHLSLPKGKIVFLLGASGCGKSTLLETLGMMNNTIASGSVSLIDDSGKRIEYQQLWKSPDDHSRNQIRKNFLSFIFQNTNLMENFTAYENICLSQMIKGDLVQEDAMQGAVELMNQVGLPQSQVGIQTLSVNLSGGQRQRVAFVRALNSNFKVLLCDEPTGNLDEVNANELMQIVKQNLGDHKTAVIVSHDINLAMRYADTIILISKNQQGYGEVLEKNIFDKSYWTSMNEHDSGIFRKSILELFTGAKSTSVRAIEKTTEKKKAINYVDLFLKKEGDMLFGKSKINLLILITIITITLVAIGFANGSLNYLNQKLSDKFVNWLTVGIPFSKSSASSVQEFCDQLNTKEIEKNYLIDTVTAYKETPLPFINIKTNEMEFIKGRLLSLEDPIKGALFSSYNFDSLQKGQKMFRDERDLGIVVTQKLLRRLGYEEDAKVIYIDNDDMDSTQNPPGHFKVPIPVRAIVKDIPGRNNFLVTEFFYNSFISHDESVFDFSGEQRKRILLYIDGNKDLAKSIKQEIEKNYQNEKFDLNEKYIEEDETTDYDYSEESDEGDVTDSSGMPKLIEKKLTITVSIDTCDQLSYGGYEVSVSFDELPHNYQTTEKLFNQINSLKIISDNKSKIIRIFDYNIAPSQEGNFHNDFLCINFKKGGLDRLEDFSKYMNKILNTGNEAEENSIIEIDAGAIKEKKNFNYISKMTWLISGLLIVFSLLAISLFISNLLKTHLNKVKMNIGTYKAFGLSDKESKSIYLKIMLRFIFIGISISLITAYGLGKLIELIFAGNMNIDDISGYFLLFEVQTYLLIFIIIGVTYTVSYININRILSKTPGDLIYNR